MCEDACAGYVCREDRIGERISIFNEGRHELVHQMGMRPTVAFEGARVSDEMRMRTVRISSAILSEVLVLRQVEKSLGGEMTDRFGQKMRVVWRPCDFGRFIEGLSGCVDHQASPLDEWPFDRLKCAEDVETFPILSHCREKRTVDARRKIGIPETNMCALDRKWRTPLRG